MVVAIDGPAGSGKSTVSFLVAKKVGYTYLDTGAMYRAAAFLKLKREMDYSLVAEMLKDVQFKFYDNGSKLSIAIKGEVPMDISEEIRLPEISAEVSSAAAVPEIRDVLTAKQREIGENSDIVIDGRDIGSVVFPDAALKIFLTASVEERAKRRYSELSAKNVDVSYDDVAKGIAARDEADCTRDHSPLVQSPDAILLDTTDIPLDGVVERVCGLVKNTKERRSAVDIEVAEYAGFCFGVERAIDIAVSASKRHGSVKTIGPIIHNPQVIERLEDMGLKVALSIDEFGGDDAVVIRSHGITKGDFDALRERCDMVFDATCPFVKKAQVAGEKLTKEGYTVVVCGDKEHPEIIGIMSYLGDSSHVVTSAEEAKSLPSGFKYALISQTTQQIEEYERIAEVVETKASSFKKINTICGATKDRQNSALALAKSCDVMLIIGGKNSGNTTRLSAICGAICPRTYHIERKEELSPEMFDNAKKIGIAAGASTPKDLIYEVCDCIEEVYK